MSIESGRGRGFDHRQSRLDEKVLATPALGKSRSLPYTLAMASGLLSTAFLAVDGSAISLAGMRDRYAALRLLDKSGCNNELGAKGAETSVRNL